MDRAVLRQIRRLEDLRALVAGVGHLPVWIELDPASLPVPVDHAACCGRAGTFEWLAIASNSPEEAARRLAATLAARGRRVGVLALDPRARVLAIGVHSDRGTTLRLLLDDPDPASWECLQRLAQCREAVGYGYLLRAEAALTIEEAGQRFFASFRNALESMAAATAPAAPPADRRTIALLQLIRVLFLYFVQARGWLNGDPAFLRQRLDDALAHRRRLHRDLFRPLFFGTLNRRAESRGKSSRFGRIPFLNGGLFEPHLLERRWRPEVPDPCWRSAFDDVFERFHFTLDPGGRPGTIAPDMLGRVFEQLMAPHERRRTGAFYTPAALVSRTVDLALEYFVAGQLGVPPHSASELLQGRDPQAVETLRNITLLDPAAGSGAFLLGALERLADLRRGEAPPSELRRRILERNLFGVDQNPMAVTLAELRLWLAVIAADDSAAPELVRPLPNLDGVVRQGDSLLEPTRVLGRLGIHPGAAGSELRALRAGFMRATGDEKREQLRRLRRTELRILSECLDRAEGRLSGEIIDTLRAAREPTLFGGRRGLDPVLTRRLHALRRQCAEVRRLARQLRREGEVPWFSFEAHFADVFAAGGFDCVLGNPPWVRAEQIPRRTRALLANRYRWWRSHGSGFSHQPDLSLAFVERGLELAKPGGLLSFLLPIKVATADYARVMRRALAEQHTLHLLADLETFPEARFAAVAYPALLIASRGAAPGAHQVRLSVTAEGSGWPQCALAGGIPWQVGRPALLSALSEVRGSHPTIGEQFTPQLGVKTGANEVFLEPPDDLEAVVVRRALRGRDLRPFRLCGGVRLFFPHSPDGEPYSRLPQAAMRHVRRHETLLRARVDFDGGPVWTLFRVRGAMGRYRVVWSDLSRSLTAVALIAEDERRLVPLNSCYVIQTRDHDSALALASWLNCSWIRAVARAAADRAASGFARFNARVVRALPLPRAVLADPELSRLARAAARGDDVQRQIDDHCADWLGLSDGSREILLRAVGPAPAHRR